MKKRVLAFTLALAIMLSATISGVAISDFEGMTEIKSTHTTLSSGDYYLSDDVNLNSGLTITGSTTVVNLYLNGKVLTGTSSTSVITVSNGATLNIYDDTTVTHEIDIPYSEGTFTVTGGLITGGTRSESLGGGGILVNGATVNMYGGNVVGNKTGDATYGAGVYVSPYTVGENIDTSLKGYFNLYGGSVSGNTSNSHGGGIYVKENGYCTIDGGSVSYNYNTSTYGGGLYIVGTVEFKDGEISYNKTALGGGGVSVVGPFIMSGGTINDNIAGGSGGGAFLGSNGVMTMTGYATVEDNTASVNSGGVFITQTSSRLAMSDYALVTNNTSTNGGGGVTLSQGYLL